MEEDELPDAAGPSPELDTAYYGRADEDSLSFYDPSPDGLPPHIRDGFDEKSGGYSPSQVYAANGVWNIKLEREDWEMEDEAADGQVRLEAFA